MEDSKGNISLGERTFWDKLTDSNEGQFLKDAYNGMTWENLGHQLRNIKSWASERPEADFLKRTYDNITSIFDFQEYGIYYFPGLEDDAVDDSTDLQNREIAEPIEAEKPDLRTPKQKFADLLKFVNQAGDTLEKKVKDRGDDDKEVISLPNEKEIINAALEVYKSHIAETWEKSRAKCLMENLTKEVISKRLDPIIIALDGEDTRKAFLETLETSDIDRILKDVATISAFDRVLGYWDGLFLKGPRQTSLAIAEGLEKDTEHVLSAIKIYETLANESADRNLFGLANTKKLNGCICLSAASAISNNESELKYEALRNIIEDKDIERVVKDSAAHHLEELTKVTSPACASREKIASTLLYYGYSHIYVRIAVKENTQRAYTYYYLEDDKLEEKLSEKNTEREALIEEIIACLQADKCCWFIALTDLLHTTLSVEELLTRIIRNPDIHPISRIHSIQKMLASNKDYQEEDALLDLKKVQRKMDKAEHCLEDKDFKATESCMTEALECLKKRTVLIDAFDSEEFNHTVYQVALAKKLCKEAPETEERAASVAAALEKGSPEEVEDTLRDLFHKGYIDALLKSPNMTRDSRATVLIHYAELEKSPIDAKEPLLELTRGVEPNASHLFRIIETLVDYYTDTLSEDEKTHLADLLSSMGNIDNVPVVEDLKARVHKFRLEYYHCYSNDTEEDLRKILSRMKEHNALKLNLLKKLGTKEHILKIAKQTDDTKYAIDAIQILRATFQVEAETLTPLIEAVYSAQDKDLIQKKGLDTEREERKILIADIMLTAGKEMQSLGHIARAAQMYYEAGMARNPKVNTRAAKALLDSGPIQERCIDALTIAYRGVDIRDGHHGARNLIYKIVEKALKSEKSEQLKKEITQFIKKKEFNWCHESYCAEATLFILKELDLKKDILAFAQNTSVDFNSRYNAAKYLVERKSFPDGTLKKLLENLFKKQKGIDIAKMMESLDEARSYAMLRAIANQRVGKHNSFKYSESKDAIESLAQITGQESMAIQCAFQHFVDQGQDPFEVKELIDKAILYMLDRDAKDEVIESLHTIFSKFPKSAENLRFFNSWNFERTITNKLLSPIADAGLESISAPNRRKLLFVLQKIKQDKDLSSDMRLCIAQILEKSEGYTEDAIEVYESIANKNDSISATIERLRKELEDGTRTPQDVPKEKLRELRVSMSALRQGVATQDARKIAQERLEYILTHCKFTQASKNKALFNLITAYNNWTGGTEDAPLRKLAAQILTNWPGKEDAAAWAWYYYSSECKTDKEQQEAYLNMAQIYTKMKGQSGYALQYWGYYANGCKTREDKQEAYLNMAQIYTKKAGYRSYALQYWGYYLKCCEGEEGKERAHLAMAQIYTKMEGESVNAIKSWELYEKVCETKEGKQEAYLKIARIYTKMAGKKDNAIKSWNLYLEDCETQEGKQEAYLNKARIYTKMKDKSDEAIRYWGYYRNEFSEDAPEYKKAEQAIKDIKEGKHEKTEGCSIQ